MTKQLGIDRAFRDRAAVDRNKLVVLPRRERVDDFGKCFLAHPAFARNEHSEVGRSNPSGRFKRGV